MCSRSCTRVFSEPTYGLKVSFVYVYKTRLLLYKATTLQAELLFPWILHTEITVFPLTSMLFSVTIRSEDVIPKMQETTGFFTVIS